MYEYSAHMTQPPDDDALLTTEQAAARLHVSRSTLMRLIYAGELETIRIPGVYPNSRNSKREHRIEPAAIERFKDRNRQRATT